MGNGNVFSRFTDARRGSVGVMAASAIGLGVLATGAAIDYASIINARAAMKTAADAAVLAAVGNPGHPAKSAESMFDLTIEQTGKRLSGIRRTHSIKAEEQILVAFAEVTTFVLGTLDDGVNTVRVESAAVAASSPKDEDSLLPCLHLGGGTAEHTLALEDGAKIVGDGCVLVLEDDDASKISIQAGSLEIDGFCVRGGTNKQNRNTLRARLGLPYIEEACNDLGDERPAQDVACRTFDVSEDIVPINGGEFFNLQGGRYCGNITMGAPEVHFASISGEVTQIEVERGEVMIAAGVFNLYETVFVLRDPGDISSIALGVEFDSAIRAPQSGPFEGIAIHQEPGRLGSALLLSGPLNIMGRVVAPGADVAINGSKVLHPVRAASLKVQAGANVTFERVDVSHVSNAARTGRLIR